MVLCKRKHGIVTEVRDTKSSFFRDNDHPDQPVQKSRSDGLENPSQATLDGAKKSGDACCGMRLSFITNRNRPLSIVYSADSNIGQGSGYW